MSVGPRGAARERVARAVSIVGHPAVTTTLAALAVAASRRAELGPPALILASVVLTVLAFSWWQVKRAAWEHVDASRPKERRTFNLVLAMALAVGALGAWGIGDPRLAAGLLSGASIVGAAAGLARWLKLSQHVGFATMAVLVTAEAVAAGVLLIGAPLIALLAWSRLELRRHTRREVAAGVLAGAAAWAVWKALAPLAG